MRQARILFFFFFFLRATGQISGLGPVKEQVTGYRSKRAACITPTVVTVKYLNPDMLNTSKVGNLAFPRVGSTGSVLCLLQPEPNLVRFLSFLAVINIILFTSFASFALGAPGRPGVLVLAQGKTLHINHIHGGLATAPAPSNNNRIRRSSSPRSLH